MAAFADMCQNSRLTLRHTFPGRGIWLLAIRDELGHVVVKLGHRLVQRSEPGSVRPCELRQVSIGHLTGYSGPAHRASRLDRTQGNEPLARLRSAYPPEPGGQLNRFYGQMAGK